jgi:mannose-6-phosphate isomerase
VPKNNLYIDVLGTSITIAADEEEGYLKNLLETYKNQVENIRSSTGLQDPLKIAVLTGFVLCDEVEKASKKPGEEEKAAEELTLNIISRLDKALGAPEKTADPGPGPGPVYQVYKLKNPVKNYDWGSPRWLPEFLGEKNISRIPWAELWMGAHPSGPSRITADAGGEAPLLPDLIARYPRYFLGEEIERDFGALPFLFKVLAAAKPLSIQAHPDAEQARQGWERENSGAVPLDAPERNYKDPNPKPEILCALSRFKALCGFRPPEEIRGLLEIFGAKSGLSSALEGLSSALGGPEDSRPLRAFLSRLYSLDPETFKRISEYGRSQALEEAYPEHSEEWALIRRLAELYPGDSGVIAPLYLNLLDLAPGEAIYLPAGILHAYVHGMGVELMANSDNVLRGGLTSKHIDLKELFRVLLFSPFKPQVLRPGVQAGTGNRPLWFRYPAPCGEFSLSLIKGGDTVFSSKGPSILLVTEGELAINGDNGELRLRQGESAFVPAGGGEIRLSGNYTLYAAGAGGSSPGQAASRAADSGT